MPKRRDGRSQRCCSDLRYELWIHDEYTFQPKARDPIQLPRPPTDTPARLPPLGAPRLPMPYLYLDRASPEAEPIASPVNVCADSYSPPHIPVAGGPPLRLCSACARALMRLSSTQINTARSVSADGTEHGRIERLANSKRATDLVLNDVRMLEAAANVRSRRPPSFVRSFAGRDRSRRCCGNGNGSAEQRPQHKRSAAAGC